MGDVEALHRGDRVDAYVIDAKLGEGGFAEVYKAHHSESGKVVALKMLDPKAALDSRVIKRFMREAKATTLVDHPNIVEVFAYGDYSSRPFIVMEYLAGETLAERIKRGGKMAVRDVLPILIDICGALARAHDAGVVHRDVKPENLFLVGDTVKVLDFGIAKYRESADATKTESGIIMGSLRTMSPEQCRAGDIDLRTDIYSLGVTAYYMLAGEYPHAKAKELEIAVAHMTKEPDPLERKAAIPVEVARIVHRCLEKEPAKRFQTMRALRDALAAIHVGAPRSSRPVVWIAVATLLAALGGGAWFLSRQPPHSTVTLAVTPADAKVTIDRQARTDGPPFSLSGTPGTHFSVTATRAGYKTITRDVTLADHDSQESIALSKGR
jgi:serine/threonine-protein kinase